VSWGWRVFVSGEATVEVAAREGPLERFGDLAVVRTEAEQTLAELVE